MKLEDISIDDVIIYLRKSQSDDPNMTVEEVLAKHESHLQEWAVETFGARVPEAHIYREVVSGETIADRPMMVAVLKLMELPGVKGVLAVEPQRFSRGDLEDCGRIVNAFRYTGTLVLTPQKVYDIADEYDRKFFEMELTKGSDYLEYYKKIQRRGRENSVKKGNFIGSVAPYGYDRYRYDEGRTKCHTLKINPVEAEAVRTMVDLYLNHGYGFQRIAYALDQLGYRPRKAAVWSPAAIKDIIENPVLIGKIRWNYRKTIKLMRDGEIVKSRPNATDGFIYVQGKHEPILDEATFQMVLERRGQNPRVRKSSELTNPYAGVLRCGTCGRMMAHKKFINKGKYYSESMICPNQARCNTRSVMYTAFEQRVIETLEASVIDFEMKLEANRNDATHANLIQKLEADLKALKEKDERQRDSLDDGIYTKSEFLSRNAKVQEQIARTTEALCNAKMHLTPEMDYREKIARFRECIETLQNPAASATQRNTLLKSCVEKIVYHNETPSKTGIGRYAENIFSLEFFLRL